MGRRRLGYADVDLFVNPMTQTFVAGQFYIVAIGTPITDVVDNRTVFGPFYFQFLDRRQCAISADADRRPRSAAFVFIIAIDTRALKNRHEHQSVVYVCYRESKTNR